MKMKRLMFAASSIAVGASLVSTVLTSCSKGTVDDKLKISLNDEGYLSNEKTQANFKQAIKDALCRSTNWATFKNALAEEIVYQWYKDRAAESKDSKEKNTTFKVNLDEWTDKINKEYDETIKSLKNKYGDKWEFYLQNETLAPLGGTEENYKHSKLVDKVKAEFLSKVFATNYFGYKTGDASSDDRKRYPNVYSPASMTVSSDKLNDPSEWKNLGFYARTNTSFTVSDTETTIDPSFLAKNPDGDYAIIQDYVFNRWFETEKPFFSAAALFKYSNPKYVAESKLAEIYNGVATGVKIPDNPNETFPFFGGYPTADSSKGTNGYAKWYAKMLKDGFDTLYETKDESSATVKKFNGTITIPKDMTEDSQTLLLSFGSQMIGGSANALYIPYANAAASLYMQMMTVDTVAADAYAPKNSIAQAKITESLYENSDLTKPVNTSKDNSIILSNFFYTAIPNDTVNKLDSYIDLSKVYPSGVGTDGKYHAPIFKDKKDYTFLHGADGQDGVKYITNAVQTSLKSKSSEATTHEQPWIFELNEAGMHCQTIDGYSIVKQQTTADAKKTAAMNVLKYRLMQKKCDYNGSLISADVFGDSGKLKSYFNDNFANIILEMALSEKLDGDGKYNIFRPISTYAKAEEHKVDNFFMKKIVESQKFSSYENLHNYINATIVYDKNKKYLDAFETANSKTFAYRSKQMENARLTEEHRTVYENGLLAPLPYAAGNFTSGTSGRIYNTSDITLFNSEVTNRDKLIEIKNKVAATDFVKAVDSVNVNAEAAMSPQITKAKAKASNRFWYYSAILDKVMYQYMSNKEGMPNYIKGQAMSKYANDIIGNDAAVQSVFKDAKHGIYATYGESKLFTNDRNYANYGTKDEEYSDVVNKTRKAESEIANTYYDNLCKNLEKDYQYKIATNGDYCDEYLNSWTYEITMAYLLGKDKNFENFYKILNSKIAEDEMAVVGYINKTNKNVFGTSVNDPTKTFTGSTVYDWTSDVNNIFDNTGYSGHTDKEAEFKNNKIASDQYWKANIKKVGDGTIDKFLAGFTGIQTKSGNQIDSASKLQAAVFDNFAKCSDHSRILTGENKIASEFKDGDRYYENYGVWFAYAGTLDSNGKVLTFPDVVWKENEQEHKVIADNFKLADGSWSPALKLGKKIAEYRTLDDLRALAKKLGASYVGDNIYRQIGDGTVKINNINELKYKMLSPLVSFDSKKNPENLRCFQRMTDAEVHEEGSDKMGQREYGFTDDKGNTFRILLTQINKSDITEKRFAPTWKNNAWDYSAMPIASSEFWYIFASMATETSVQQLAISEVVKHVYGDDKLVVYDAQLYNCFDSVWIKDWSKKTMGA